MADHSGRREVAPDGGPGGPSPPTDRADAEVTPGDDERRGDDGGGDDPHVDDADLDAPPLPPRRSRPVVVTVVIALGLLGAMWTLASPVGSSPDDDFHLASIRCAWTAPDDACRVIGDSFSPGEIFVEVPAEIGPSAFCFTAQFEAPGEPMEEQASFRSAACQERIVAGSFAVTLANDHLYPGLYYTVLGLTILDQPVDSALLARFVSWTICMALLAAGWAVLPRQHRHAYTLVLLVVAVPHAVFLWASTNPSGVVVAAVSAGWAATIALFHATERRQFLTAGGLLAAATVAAAGSRSDGGLYLSVVLVAACVLMWRRDRRWSKTSAAVVGTGLLGLTTSVIVLSRRLDSQGGLVATRAEEAVASGEELVIWNNLLEIPDFISGNLGFTGLGWLDTRMPYSVWVTLVAVFFFLVFWGIGRIDRAKGASLACVLGGLLGIPFLLLLRGAYTVGQEIQPRYVLPVLPILGFTALYWRRRSAPAAMTAGQLWTVVVLASMAHGIALHTNIRRYVTGLDRRSPNLDVDREWWWDIPLTPNMVWVGGTAAFAVVAFVVGRSIRAAAQGYEPATDRTAA